MTTETLDTGTQSAAASSTTEGGQTATPGFLDTLPDDLKAAPSLQNFKDTASLAKSYVEAQSMIGKSVRVPADGASPEEVSAFYEKIGRPKTAEDYRLAAEASPLLDPAQVKNFKAVAHSLGLTNSQADALVKFEATRSLQMSQAQETAQAAAQAAAEQSRAKCNDTLKEAWGNDFDNRLSIAKELKDHFGSKYPDAVKELVEGPSGNNPVLLMVLSELGKTYRETGIITGNRSINFGITPDEARSQISAIHNDPKHAYHAGNKEAISKVEQLYKAAYPGGN